MLPKDLSMDSCFSIPKVIVLYPISLGHVIVEMEIGVAKEEKYPISLDDQNLNKKLFAKCRNEYHLLLKKMKSIKS